MKLITRPFSVAELSQKILEMATTGVYRESVFEALQPIATKKQVRAAIAHAKQLGLTSVASLRDPELGTYYQLDPIKFEALLPEPQHGVKGDAEELALRLTQATRTTQHMLTLAKGLGIALLLPGLAAAVSGLYPLSCGFLGAALSALMLASLQRQLSRQLRSATEPE